MDGYLKGLVFNDMNLEKNQTNSGTALTNIQKFSDEIKDLRSLIEKEKSKE